MDALLARITGEQLEEWKAFYELEPWGSPHEDLRFGLLLSQQHNMNRDRRKDRALSPWDFLPSCGPNDGGRGRATSAQEQVAWGRAWASSMVRSLKRTGDRRGRQHRKTVRPDLGHGDADGRRD